MKLKQVSDIPSEWEVLNVRKKTTVQIRPALVEEKFTVSWADAELVSDPAVDLIVIQPNGKEYPCKSDIFYDTYVPKDSKIDTANNQVTIETWIKSAQTQIVRIPEGVEVEIETLEGVLPVVTFPDFIAIGAKGELYANTADFVEKNLEIL